MEAELVEELPTGDWQYEPKWDGFRGVLENDGGELALWSRNGRPLLRYFPELEPLGKLLPPHSALDGEIVISKKGRLDFDSMQLRLHPAESRIRKLSAEIPARFIAFDILLWKGESIHELPLELLAPLLERQLVDRLALPQEDVERDEPRRDLRRELADPALRRVQPQLHRVEVESPLLRDDDLTVESGVGRQQLAEGRELGEVAEKRPPVPAPKRELAAVVLEHAAKAVPLRLVLPVAGRQLLDELGLHRRKRNVGSGHGH